MKKRFAVFLAVLLAAAMCVPALGAESLEATGEAMDDMLEMRMDEFCMHWAARDYQGLVQWLPSAWREDEADPAERLADMLRVHTLLDWRLDGASLGRLEEGEATITIYAMMQAVAAAEMDLHRLEARAVWEGGDWRIDPDSLMEGRKIWPGIQKKAGQEAAVETPEAMDALVGFMEAWYTGIADDMVPFTTPVWRAKMGTTKNGPAQNLYWKFSPKKLESWYAEEETPATSQGITAHFVVFANITAPIGTGTYRYDALCVQVDGQWYVDPDTLAGGTRVEQALSDGDSGTEVVQLQKRLKYYGFLTGEISGSYDAATAEAVRAFQEAANLAADGVATEETIRALYSMPYEEEPADPEPGKG